MKNVYSHLTRTSRDIVLLQVLHSTFMLTTIDVVYKFPLSGRRFLTFAFDCKRTRPSSSTQSAHLVTYSLSQGRDVCRWRTRDRYSALNERRNNA